MKPFITELLEPDTCLEMPPRTIQLIPTKLNIFPDGTLKGEPSFAIELSAADLNPVVIAQLSLRMLIESLDSRSLEFLKQAIDKMTT